MGMIRALLTAACLVAAACGGEPSGDRCPRCGMENAPSIRFNAGFGDDATFDSAKCMLRTHVETPGAAPWVTDYYARTRVPLDEAFLVIGSDVLSPMGHDLIALGTEAAATDFVRDHGGEVKRAADVNGALLRGLE